MFRRVLLSLFLLILAGFLIAPAKADNVLASQTNNYFYGGNPSAVSIYSEVHDHGALYLWRYVVTNNSYDPFPGLTNGFSGFELGLPVFVPDIANVTAPNASWEINCCSGLPVEWDIRSNIGPGIMPGSSGEFSFTTNPRTISVATNGWFHTWQDFGFGPTQVEIVNYGRDNAPLAPLFPEAQVPEPGTLVLFGTGLLGLVSGKFSRRKRS